MILKIGLLASLLLVSTVVGENEFDAGNLDFTLNFFKHFYNTTSNSVVSPVSVRLALAAMYQAAGPTIGKTIQAAISLPAGEKSRVAGDARQFLASIKNDQFQVLFKAFKMRDPLDPTFEKALQTVFDSAVETVDFRDKTMITKSVNQWVSEATNHLIEEFIDESTVDPNTEFMLINAVALKARWASKFPKENTRKMTFNFLNGDREVEMMRQVMSVPYKIAEDFHAAELLYTEESDLSMWIILPRGRGSLGELVRALTPEMVENMRVGSKQVSLAIELPRFSIKNDFNVDHVLKKMGHGDLFAKKDLQVFTGRLSEIDDIFQSAVVKVDEEGTEAVAATRVNVKWRVGPRPFLANKPFIFFIQKRSTNAILFIGQYSNHED